MRRKFKEIVSRYTWQEVEQHYLRLYLKEKSKSKEAREALEYLQSLEPARSDMRIYIEYREDQEGGYHEVLGRDGSLGRHGQEESYALFLVDWDEWLGMEIEANTLKQYSELDVLCHCFWEMTWCGYSVGKVGKFREELDQLKAEEPKNFEELQLL
jgi:hypothetical protein